MVVVDLVVDLPVAANVEPPARGDQDVRRQQLADVLENFLGRHRNLLEKFEARANEMEEAFAAHGSFSKIQRQLIGAYFLNEYSFEASALFNPSIVPHPDQSNAPKGGLRFILSLRAIGEGHVSSVTFRTGTWRPGGTLSIDDPCPAGIPPQLERREGDVDTDVVDEGDFALAEELLLE